MTGAAPLGGGGCYSPVVFDLYHSLGLMLSAGWLFAPRSVTATFIG